MGITTTAAHEHMRDRSHKCRSPRRVLIHTPAPASAPAGHYDHAHSELSLRLQVAQCMRALAHDCRGGGHQPQHANVAVEFLHPACASVRDLDHYAHSIGAQWVVLLRDPARDHEGGGQGEPISSVQGRAVWLRRMNRGRHHTRALALALGTFEDSVEEQMSGHDLYGAQLDAAGAGQSHDQAEAESEVLLQEAGGGGDGLQGVETLARAALEQITGSSANDMASVPKQVRNRLQLVSRAPPQCSPLYACALTPTRFHLSTQYTAMRKNQAGALLSSKSVGETLPLRVQVEVDASSTDHRQKADTRNDNVAVQDAATAHLRALMCAPPNIPVIAVAVPIAALRAICTCYLAGASPARRAATKMIQHDAQLRKHREKLTRVLVRLDELSAADADTSAKIVAPQLPPVPPQSPSAQPPARHQPPTPSSSQQQSQRAVFLYSTLDKSFDLLTLTVRPDP